MDKYTEMILNLEQRNIKSKLEADLARAKYERQQAMMNNCTDVIAAYSHQIVMSMFYLAMKTPQKV